MYYICKPTKIKIYINSARKTAAQIRQETGCDALINGGLYDGSFHPCCWLRVDGQNLSSETWSDWGYGWDDGADIKMDTSNCESYYRNFISCVSLISPGVLSYPKALGGVRGRSAIGLTQDNRLILFCTKDGTGDAMSPEILRARILQLGAVSALMLDSGGSSQCIFPNGKVVSSRKVHNYICVWVEKRPEQSNPQCPYAEPTHNVGRWCFLASRDENRWVQWQLNRHGANLDVDGAFGKLSDAALRIFQRAYGLNADGICGKLTREELKK